MAWLVERMNDGLSESDKRDLIGSLIALSDCVTDSELPAYKKGWAEEAMTLIWMVAPALKFGKNKRGGQIHLLNYFQYIEPLIEFGIETSPVCRSNNHNGSFFTLQLGIPLDEIQRGYSANVLDTEICFDPNRPCKSSYDIKVWQYGEYNCEVAREIFGVVPRQGSICITGTNVAILMPPVFNKKTSFNFSFFPLQETLRKSLMFFPSALSDADNGQSMLDF